MHWRLSPASKAMRQGPASYLPMPLSLKSCLAPWRGSGPHCRLSSSIQSEVSFEGAYGNLKRLYDKAAKMYHQLKKCETRKLSPSRKRCVGPVKRRRGLLSCCCRASGILELPHVTLGFFHFRCKDIKRLLVNFMYLQSLLQPKSR